MLWHKVRQALPGILGLKPGEIRATCRSLYIEGNRVWCTAMSAPQQLLTAGRSCPGGLKAWTLASQRQAPVVTMSPLARLCVGMILQEPGISETEKFLQLVAMARGKLKKGGVPDMKVAARVVLQVRAGLSTFAMWGVV